MLALDSNDVSITDSFLNEHHPNFAVKALPQIIFDVCTYKAVSMHGGNRFAEVQPKSLFHDA